MACAQAPSKDDVVFLFWGKYRDESWLPALCHMIDTGLVAREMVRGLPKVISEKMAKEFSIPLNTLINTLAFWAALHDIGKISPGFQNKNPKFAAALKKRGFHFSLTAETLHGKVTLATLPDILMDELHCGDDLAYGLGSILGAHHGTFSSGDSFSPGEGLWEESRLAVVRQLADFFRVTTLEKISQPSLPVLMMLAGLVSVADWLSSAEYLFGYTSEAVGPLEDYLKQRGTIAREIVSKLKMAGPRVQAQGFKALFGFDRPNACQDTALNVSARLSHPMLIAVESTMGSGKTEAAQAVYQEIAIRSGIGGLYYSLPTQATGNAMLPRMLSFLKHLKPEGGAELHLLHGNADLNEDYEMLRAQGINGGDQDVTASSWFAARKRGLLAGYGVGTIDQALLAALKIRHFFVRLFGLSGKVLVLDEVHAYDVYIQEEIFCLLGWLGQCETSVILLSATLTPSLRKKLFRAFYPKANLPDQISYPCVTGVGLKEGVVVWESIPDDAPVPIIIKTTIAANEDKGRIVQNIMEEKLSQGGLAACIVNTVKEAQIIYRQLRVKMKDTEILLFHSRFTRQRRLAIEGQLLSMAGKGAKRPARAVVVATQVMEQSLDVDFDFMVSDLAPADLLLQRAGRLHRHPGVRRSEQLKTRTLMVLVPDYRDKSPDFGDSGFVYEKDVLLRSALWLSQEGLESERKVSMPGNGVDWIERVYEIADPVPDHLEKAFDTWAQERQGEEKAEQFLARSNTLRPVHDCLYDVDYLCDLSNDVDEEIVISTRLGQESMSLVILPKDSGNSALEKTARDLLLNSVEVSTPAIVKRVKDLEIPSAWDKIPQLCRARPLYMEAGQAVAFPEIYYDDDVGLELKQDR